MRSRKVSETSDPALTDWNYAQEPGSPRNCFCNSFHQTALPVVLSEMYLLPEGSFDNNNDFPPFFGANHSVLNRMGMVGGHNLIVGGVQLVIACCRVAA